MTKAKSRYTRYVLEKNIFRCNHNVQFESTNIYKKYKADFCIPSFKMNIFMSVITFNHAI